MFKSACVTSFMDDPFVDSDKKDFFFFAFFQGKMMLSRVHTRELQLLVGGLGIDPGNVKLEIVVILKNNKVIFH